MRKIKMKIVFLDFDGVLNNPTCYRAGSGSHTPADPACVAALNHITDTAGALIVISSTWRLMGLMPCKDYLRSWGVTGKVLDTTPRLLDHNFTGQHPTTTQQPRGCEIGEWLRRVADYYDIESFVILDDDSDMAGHKNRLVQTANIVGLTWADAELAIAMLSRPVGILTA